MRDGVAQLGLEPLDRLPVVVRLHLPTIITNGPRAAVRAGPLPACPVPAASAVVVRSYAVVAPVAPVVAPASPALAPAAVPAGPRGRVRAPVARCVALAEAPRVVPARAHPAPVAAVAVAELALAPVARVAVACGRRGCPPRSPRASHGRSRSGSRARAAPVAAIRRRSVAARDHDTARDAHVRSGIRRQEPPRPATNSTPAIVSLFMAVLRSPRRPDLVQRPCRASPCAQAKASEAVVVCACGATATSREDTRRSARGAILRPAHKNAQSAASGCRRARRRGDERGPLSRQAGRRVRRRARCAARARPEGPAHARPDRRHDRLRQDRPRRSCSSRRCSARACR